MLGNDLSDIADQIERELDATVADSPYDALPPDDREAIAWVREHGGLEAVKAHWKGYVPATWLEKAKSSYERKRDNLKAHAWELERKCGERRERVMELRKTIADMRPRLMPEDMCWPRFEDDAPVRLGDEISWRDDGGAVNSIELQNGGYFILHAADGADDWIHPQYFPGERVKRPAPKVLDADGVEIRVGDTVWPKYPDSDPRNAVESAEVVYVHRLGRVDVQAKYATGMSFREQVNADQLTHRTPVLAADGKPLREGETVWYVPTPGEAIECVVDELPDRDKGEGQVTSKATGRNRTIFCPPSYLTHERPDSWERLEEDASKSSCEYFEQSHGCGSCPKYPSSCGYDKARDLVRRAKALAERDV